MSSSRVIKDIAEWNDQKIAPGEQRDLMLAVSESYSGMTVEIPIQIRRALKDGPSVFVTGALHGDEINGTGAIRTLIQDDSFVLKAGSLILIPVLNILAFDRHSRYLPDRRDLNRSFPGSANGTLASRMACTIFEEIVGRCNYGIDLHTAAVRRTNYPTVRGDLANPEIALIAEAFGGEVLLNKKGPVGSFRRSATKSGCPTIVMEGGEVWKVEPTIVEVAVRGVKNVLRKLEMLDGEMEVPDYQVQISKTKWLRAEHGGFLDFHVKPGEIVDKKQPLVTNSSLLGVEREVVYAPFSGVVLGMTTLPAVSPGEPILHLGKFPKGVTPTKFRKQRSDEEDLEEHHEKNLAERIVENLASNVTITKAPGEEE